MNRLVAPPVIALALAVASSCTPSSKTRGAAAGATVLVGRAADVLGLDPARIDDFESAEVTEQIFDHLVRYRRNSTEIEPALATRWEVTHDGRAWLFHLRPNVRFHDGTPCDAEAVVFSFDRQRDPNHPYHLPGFNYWETTFRNILSVEALDPLTVRITIERSYAPFLANLAMFPVSIVSPTAVRRWGSEFYRHPVGTGPFRFVEWSPDERVTLEANPDYWDGPPHIDHLVFVAIHDARQRLVALESGAVDLAENLSPEDLQFVSLHPDLTLYRVAGNQVGYLAMNTLHPPFDDVRVRRALNYAVNKAAIVKLVYQGLAQPATTPVPLSLWSHRDQPLYHYDREEARRLLAEAHYRPGPRRLRLFTTDAPRPYMPAPETVARIIQHNLQDVGLDVEVVTQDFDSQVRRTQRGEHDLCLMGWSGDNGDPDNFLYVLLDPENAHPGAARNLAFYKNPQLHGKLVWAQESSDRAERERFYEEAQEIFARDAPWVPLAYAEVVVAARTSLRGVLVHPSSNVYFHQVSLR